MEDGKMPLGRLEPQRLHGCYIVPLAVRSPLVSFAAGWLPSAKLQQHMKRRTHNRHHRPGWLLSRRVPATKGRYVHGLKCRASSLWRLPNDIHPDEVYSLAAQSHVRAMFDMAEYTADVTGARSPAAASRVSARGTSMSLLSGSACERFSSAAPPSERIRSLSPVQPTPVPNSSLTASPSAIARVMDCSLLRYSLQSNDPPARRGDGGLAARARTSHTIPTKPLSWQLRGAPRPVVMP
jgi:hypothetical protein